MAKKKDGYRWCLLWQSEKKTIEEVLREGVEAFGKKYGGNKPDFISVFNDCKLTSHDGINLIKDRMIFHMQLISMPIPENTKENDK
jgi:hypothetical protein